MRALAVVVAVPLALVGWQWWSDRSAERLLTPIASQVAGREVVVDCQSLWANLLDALPRHGEVRFDANGVPEPAADLLVGLFAASRRGEFAAVDPTLERLLGRPPLTVRDVLKA